jgi:hypothetical protein
MTNEKKHTKLGKRVAGCVVGAVLTTACVMGVCGNYVEANACESELTADTNTTQTFNAMYRLYNPYTGEHFYTADKAEKTKCITAGWRDEGIGWYAPLTSKTPVYRLYNKYAPGGDHHYTFNKSEYDSLIKKGWSGEGVGWYSDDEKQVMLYRQYNPFAQTGTHNYTTSKSENDNLDKVGWNAEGTAWYGVQHATHNWVTVNHPAVTHEEPIYETKTVCKVVCNVHKTEHLTQEEKDAKNTPEEKAKRKAAGESEIWYFWCSSSPACGAPCQNVYSTEKVQTGTKTIVDTEAYSETYCSDCGCSK